MRLIALTLSFVCAAWAALADVYDMRFPSIDGGELAFSQWSGQPVLVVNTASRCAFTDQYEQLQALYDTYRDDGLVVLAVPSNDFRQELSSAEEVLEFCELTYGIDMPMTDILSVRGSGAHPFYAFLAREDGFVPAWNFNKVLIGPDGQVVDTWGSRVRPMSREIRRAVEGVMPGA